MILLAFGGFANAQIKVVGNDYKETLTGAKAYYERDVDFESVFPSVSSKEYYGSLSPYFSSIGDFSPEKESYRFQINRTGDTVYLIHEMNLKESGEFAYGFATDSYGNLLSTLPSGYYVIQGYTFCSEETEKVEENAGLHAGSYCTTGYSSKELKENILKEKDKLEIERYIGYIILNNVNNDGTNNHIVAYLNLRTCLSELNRNCYHWRNMNEEIIFTEFYNEIKKTFIGQKVVLSYGFDNSLKEIEFNPLIKDGLRDEVFKLNDRVFSFKDIVMKGNGHFFAILEGKNSGSFSIEVQNIKYLYSIANKELYPSREYVYMGYLLESRNPNNTIKDISALVAKSENYLLWIVREQDLSIMKKRARLSKEQSMKEVQSKARQIKQQKQAQENEYKNLMIAKYGTEYGTLVGNHQIAINMTKEMCRDAWGNPMNKYRTTTSFGQSEVWCYNYKTRVYFYDGKVVQIDD